MRKMTLLLAAAAATSSIALVGEKDAEACGGCFHEPTENDSIITDHRMVLSISPTQTTLYDQIEYQGSPTSFAWVLPIHGTVNVGLSADVMFGTLDSLTQTTVNPPAPNCPPPPSCGQGLSAAGGGTAPPSAENGGVTVLKQQVVGPYATVQLAAADPNALANWLSQNGYNLPQAVQPIVSAYIQEGFGFLALKLVPGAGVQAMLPVRVSTQGASPILPLRMVAAGTGATVGITLWVVSDGRYEPQNFPFFHIDDSQLVWDWSTNSSNFKTLRAQNEAQLGGRGWEVESSISLDEQTIESIVLSGGAGAGGNPTPASGDYQPETLPNGQTETPDQVRMDDMNTLFAGMAGPNVRVTRLRSDLAHGALDQDLTLQASSDQSVLSNVHNVTRSVNAPQCPIYGSDCSIIGYGPGGTSNGNGAGASGSGSSFACSAGAHRSQYPLGALLAFGIFAGFVGLGVLRVRKRGD